MSGPSLWDIFGAGLKGRPRRWGRPFSKWGSGPSPLFFGAGNGGQVRKYKGMARSLGELEHELTERVGALGYDVVQLERAGSQRRPILRVRIDLPEGSEAGVTVDDCAKVSRAVEAWLDESSTVPERYVLEVSSPGVERPLTRPRDWVRFAGRRAAVKSRETLAGIGRRLEGTILEPDGKDSDPETQEVRLRLDNGEVVAIPLDQVQRANLVHEWK